MFLPEFVQTTVILATAAWKAGSEPHSMTPDPVHPVHPLKNSKMLPNSVKKLILEGCAEITLGGLENIKNLKRLEYLNLIHVKLDDSFVKVLISMESLREVYLFETGLSEDAIKLLKDAKPQMFVNSG